MATAINRAPRVDEIKLETNVPQTFALKFATGKVVGQWGNIMFTAVDERRLFLNTEDASEFNQGLLAIGYQPADFIRVTRVKHGTTKGGGFAIRVERVRDEPQTDRDYTRDLAQSIATAEEAKRVRAQRARTSGPVATPAPPADNIDVQQQASAGRGPMSKMLAGALIASIDAYAIAGDYAKSKGLPIVFGSEDIRCSANSMLIEFWRNGGGR
jgi:hypothetical protein